MKKLVLVVFMLLLTLTFLGTGGCGGGGGSSPPGTNHGGENIIVSTSTNNSNPTSTVTTQPTDTPTSTPIVTLNYEYVGKASTDSEPGFLEIVGEKIFVSCVERNERTIIDEFDLDLHKTATYPLNANYGFYNSSRNIATDSDGFHYFEGSTPGTAGCYGKANSNWESIQKFSTTHEVVFIRVYENRLYILMTQGGNNYTVGQYDLASGNLISMWPISGNSLYPRHMAIDSHGHIWISFLFAPNTGYWFPYGEIKEFDQAGVVLRDIQSQGLQNPCINIDKNDYLYIGHKLYSSNTTGGLTILDINDNCRIIGQITMPLKDDGSGTYYNPCTGICIDDHGNMYIIDHTENLLLKFRKL